MNISPVHNVDGGLRAPCLLLVPSCLTAFLISLTDRLMLPECLADQYVFLACILEVSA